MQLEESIEKYSVAGLGVVAISYDTVETLKSFDDRMGGFSYSMLADPNSEIIETFGIRNPNPAPGSRTDGMAFPGSYIVNADGIVQEKFFEKNGRVRPTAETVLMKTLVLTVVVAQKCSCHSSILLRMRRRIAGGRVTR